jgi:hypothetical protein
MAHSWTWENKPIGKVKKGALHSELGIKQGEHISIATLEAAKAKAKHTGNATLMKRANFALNARKWKH